MGLISLLFIKGGEYPSLFPHCLLMFNECKVQAKQHESIIKHKKMQITQTKTEITAT